ncbi:zf-HC2 domain-containing protein [Streptomyces sp. V3I7]|uniref:zf-HC2 domain-containing protein n=1 Tax=Streptomyces sp. V3I7 TaxID=3042278 RepID=UPI002785EDDD|nr:zf-HC2 domain-containing protein [Streptomyces sp. V3I7]MDQ0994676.1 hypothetical protein [Streptomyces sp. V3I7]
MASNVTCEKLQELGPELALGVLPGRERAEAVAHLDRCADCRQSIGQLTLVGDGLFGLLPDREPPVGFESRVARSLSHAAAEREGRPRARKHRRPFPSSGPWSSERGRLRVASVMAGFALIAGFGGWAVGTAIENAAAPPGQVEVASGVMDADLMTSGPGSQTAGKIFADPGPPGWVYVSIDLEDAGIDYEGKINCLLEHSDGTTVPVRTFSLHDGYGVWEVPMPVDTSKLSGARLTYADGTTLATARFESSA